MAIQESVLTLRVLAMCLFVFAVLTLRVLAMCLFVFAPEGQLAEESIQTAACRCCGTSLCDVQGTAFSNDFDINCSMCLTSVNTIFSCTVHNYLICLNANKTEKKKNDL